MSAFQIGRTYTTRSVCDHDCVISVPVIARTAKTITTSMRGETKILRIAVRNGIELVKPWGTYSMAPIVTADQ